MTTDTQKSMDAIIDASHTTRRDEWVNAAIKRGHDDQSGQMIVCTTKTVDYTKKSADIKRRILQNKDKEGTYWIEESPFDNKRWVVYKKVRKLSHDEFAKEHKRGYEISHGSNVDFAISRGHYVPEDVLIEHKRFKRLEKTSPDSWTLTLDEYAASRGDDRDVCTETHRANVKFAMRRGKYVPKNVLKDYPDLVDVSEMQ